VLSATALAPTAAEADALSTAFYVAGPEHSAEYCALHPAVAAVILCPGERRGGIVRHMFGLGDNDWLSTDIG
jgi:thiamine biosynthesis lipoprotein